MPYSLSLPDADVDIWRAHLDLIETSRKTCEPSARSDSRKRSTRRSAPGVNSSRIDAEPYLRTLMALDDEARTWIGAIVAGGRSKGAVRAMTRIKALRILPPFAIARLGSADEPMDNYTIEIDPPAANDKEPLGYRALKPLPTLIVGERSGEIEACQEAAVPARIQA